MVVILQGGGGGNSGELVLKLNLIPCLGENFDEHPAEGNLYSLCMFKISVIRYRKHYSSVPEGSCN